MDYPVVVPVGRPPYTKQYVVSSGENLVDVPILASLRSGTYWFVDGTNGSDDADGRSWVASLATIGEALTRSAARDVILVREGTYAENLIVATNYVTIMGEVTGGYGKPDIGAASGITLIVRAQGVVLAHLRIFSDDIDSDLVRIEGNGGILYDCVLDGSATQGDTKAILRMWTHVTDDSMTGSEWIVKDVTFRSAGGFGLVFDCADALVGVLPTDNRFLNCNFYSGDKEDIFVAATAVAVNGLHRTVFDHCLIGGGTSKNKATHVDIKTNKIGTPDTEFIDCFVNDDTIDTTAMKVDAVGASLIGCYSLDGVVDGDLLD